MIHNDPERPSKAAAEHAEDALDQAPLQSVPASDAVSLRQWNELEASRVAREVRIEDRSPLDRLAQYFRGPTAFSA